MILQSSHLSDLRVTTSVNGNAIRITAERWVHVVEHHEEVSGMLDDVAEAIDAPEAVFAGRENASIAVKSYDTGIWIVAVYIDREDGFMSLPS